MIATLMALSLMSSAQPGPSFDCARATSASERAICADPILSALDRDMAAAYAAAWARISPAARRALRSDQQAFLRVRENVEALDGQPAMDGVANLGDQMAVRSSFLNQIRRPSRGDLIGVWGNVSGGVSIRQVEGGRLIAEITTANPVNGSWICQVEIAGRVTGGRLTGRPASDPAVTISIIRRDGFIEVSETASGESAITPGYCGHNGYVAGTYLPVRAQ
ncbi:lysozyme inhibitor LprI family protein [Brevundimonas aveniformis]|uniref:lysozyme inhibitor LprI family protein n=1 Tax=Brevundimonas aveniformis TaxID=370977 RepID=UPI00041394F6|nr:lysozyme inhibitor LprI family protein [Brevundimonas aveniformis]